MGNTCCCKDTPSFSFKDCMKDINIKSSCISSCCINGNSKIEKNIEKEKEKENSIHSHHSHHHHHHKHNKHQKH